ncbi:hypothetical protein M8J76_008681 [Diaphorina citri]|nr:hypothetical protein M8J76_008681 [Diaphorina citri]
MSTQISIRGDSTSGKLSYSDIAAQLLEDKLLLTALELYFELLEVGKDIPKLREFFSNPGNFEQQSASRLEYLSSIPRSSSQATLDSLDFTRYSEDGERGVDERVAILEFELRKAKETISSLRANLTDATTEVEESSDHGQKSFPPCDPIKPHEKRCLNFLINEYLLHHNYKLTSITFADENEDQDFDDWDDVGLNTAKPAELVQLYRDGLRSSGNGGVNICEQCCQTDEESNLLVEELAEMSGKISSLELEKSELKTEIATLRTPRARSTSQGVYSRHEPHPMEPRSNIDYLRTTLARSTSQGVYTRSHEPRPSEPTSNIDEPDRVASELANAIDTDRDSTHFDLSEEVDSSPVELRGIDSTPTDTLRSESCQQLDRDSNILDRESTQLDRDSTHFAEDVLSVRDQDRFELIGGDRTHTSTNGSQDRLSLDVGGDDHSSLNDNDWTRVSYVTTHTHDTRDDVISNALCHRNFPEAFQKEILSRCYVRATHVHPLCLELDSSEGHLTPPMFLDLVTKTVIHQSQNDDLFPLLLATILLHSDPAQRETLIQVLFNTKKRPNEAERKIIVAGLHSILKHSPDLETTEAELLAPLWELLGSKYLDRRLLVAEICAAFGPHVRPAARAMYVLPILQQLLLQDRDALVRVSVVKSLALTVTFIDDVDKYVQCEELLMTGLSDVSRDVVEMTSQLLLPVMAKWSLDLRRLQSHFLVKLMQLISSQVKKTSEQDLSASPSASSSSKWELRACASLHALTSSLPYLVIFVASAEVVLDRLDSETEPARPRPHFAPLCKGLFSPSVFYEGSVPGLMRVFDHVTGEGEEWEELDWLKTTFLPQLLDIAESVSVSHHPTLVSYIITLIRSFCAGFGPHLTQTLVRPLFLERIDRLEKSLANVRTEWTSMILLPVYVLGVLVELTDVQEELQSLLKHFMFSLALCGAPIDSLSYTIRELSRFSQYQDTVVAALWEGVVHARPLVRVVTAQLILETIPQVSDSLLTIKIVPALVTLSSDPDVSVKTATVPVFGSLLLNQTKKEIQDKTYFQFQTFLGDETLLENHAAQICLIGTLGKIAPCSLAWFREDAIAPQLCSWASSLCLLQSSTRKQDVLLALLDAFSNVLYTSLSPNTITIYMLPGLRQLEVPCTDLVPGQLETLRGMIKEAESRAGHRPVPSTPVQR